MQQKCGSRPELDRVAQNLAQAAKRSKRDTERHPIESESESSASRRGRKLWEEIHTVNYHRCSQCNIAFEVYKLFFCSNHHASSAFWQPAF